MQAIFEHVTTIERNDADIEIKVEFDVIPESPGGPFAPYCPQETEILTATFDGEGVELTAQERKRIIREIEGG